MGVSSAKSEKICRVFIEALASAIREWLLLFLLLLNAIIAYLVTKFSRCCGLQPPCLLCSRLDHVLGNEKSGYYWDMICGTHKFEISALAICHIHSSRGHVHDAMKIVGGGCFGSLSHVGYTDQKANRDTESDVFMFSDDDATGVLVLAPLESPVLVSKEQADSSRDSATSLWTKGGADDDREAGNVESSVEIGFQEWGSEIKNYSVFFEDFRSSETGAAEANKSAETDEAIEKPIPTPEKSTEQTSQEVPSISNDRESEESESESRPRQDPGIELSPKVNNLNELSSVTIPNSSSSNELDTLETKESDLSMEMLKRQIEDDKTALQELQKELEEERNASAIAANETMSMITRLQEEKANLYMEAQQYLRMMEEQAEYDMEELQKSNDLLVEREMEIQNLEDELESYRINEPFTENINDSLLCIEDERVYLQQCLKKLAEKLRVSSENTNHENEGDSDDSLAKEVSNLQERLEKLETGRAFIERAIKYLRIGDEGLLFIQDLASHLQELRNIQL